MTARDFMQHLELRVPPVMVGAVFAAAMFGATYLLPALSFMVRFQSTLALTLGVVGALFAVAAVVVFRGQRTTVNALNPSASTSVVTGGVYSLSRNPMYLGLLLGLVGRAVYLSNVASAPLLPGFVAYMKRFQIVPEERALLAKFGTQFEQYSSRVGRWV